MLKHGKLSCSGNLSGQPVPVFGSPNGKKKNKNHVLVFRWNIDVVLFDLVLGCCSGFGFAFYFSFVPLAS